MNGPELEAEFWSQNKYSTKHFRITQLPDVWAAPCTHREEVLWWLIPVELDEVLGIMLSHYLLERTK